MTFKWNNGEPPYKYKDGRLLLLVVCYVDDSHQECEAGLLEDAVRYSRTVGSNNHKNVYDPKDKKLGDEWQFVGWDWCQDEYAKGPTNVKIVKWAEFPAPPKGFSHMDS